MDANRVDGPVSGYTNEERLSHHRMYRPRV